MPELMNTATTLGCILEDLRIDLMLSEVLDGETDQDLVREIAALEALNHG